MIYQIVDLKKLNKPEIVNQLENGMVIYLPNLKFELTDKEKYLIANKQFPVSAKNISYCHISDKIKGIDLDMHNDVRPMLARYQKFATELITTLCPDYTRNIEIARTSYRPIEIRGRKSSPRKDDTRLHVDAFPSNPNGGKRILRVFNNINPNGELRQWRLGEPFVNVAKQFAPKVPPYFPAFARLQEKLGNTKSLRTKYDHTMLHIHNKMKYDMHYQVSAPQMEFNFPPESTWIVYTDIVSHAAMAGSQALEQTFNLPIEGMVEPGKSPKRILEKFSN